MSSVVNCCPRGRKLPGQPPGIMSWEDKIFFYNNCPPGKCPGGQNSLQQNNSLQRENCISPLHHLTIDGNMSQKNDSPLENFTISPLHHIMISPFQHTVCSKNIDSPLHHLVNEKKHCTISTQNHIDTFQSSYHITTSLYHDFTISPRCYKCEPIHYNKKRSDIIKKSKYSSNVSINTYKHSSRY